MSALEVADLVRALKVVDLSFVNKQSRVFVESIPGYCADVVSEVHAVSEGGRSVDHPGVNQTLRDAAERAKALCLRLAGNVPPQNVLLFFGESEKVPTYLPLDAQICCAPSNQSESKGDQPYAGKKEGRAYDWAVILCQVSDTDVLRQLSGISEHEARANRYCYQVRGADLDRLRDRLDGLFEHRQILADEVQS